MRADLIIINANVATMDMRLPRAEAIAIAGGRILALGDTHAMRALAGKSTPIIDAGGRLVLPGFQDAHIHLMDGGTDRIASAELVDAVSIRQLQDALAAHARRVKLPLITGVRWTPGFFGDHNLTREVLDAVVPDLPCIVYDTSYHSACINSAAIRMAGLAASTIDPPNGHFVKDASGIPTGMLHEDAIYRVLPRLPQWTDANYADGLREGQAHANRHGITGILDAQLLDRHVAAYGGLDRAGQLTLRVCGAAAVSPADTAASVVERLAALRNAHCSDNFSIHSAKFFFDGVFENRTGAMIEPYADAAGGNGALMYQPEKIRELFVALDAARFQIHVHVIGDGAVRAALDGFEAAINANGRWPALHQLAHLQLVHRDDFARIGALGAMANIQPLWAHWYPGIPDPTMAMVGEERAHLVYAFRRMLIGAAPYCLSSDYPVTTLNPFQIMQTAVTRMPPERHPACEAFFADQCLTVEEAVLGYTVNAANACWRGHNTGRLLPGFSADLVILDRDLFNCARNEIGETQVELTLFKGTEVYRSADFSR